MESGCFCPNASSELVDMILPQKSRPTLSSVDGYAECVMHSMARLDVREDVDEVVELPLVYVVRVHHHDAPTPRSTIAGPHLALVCSIM
mmetsp:Transcript_44366/g.65832  ORF Transcript_44366/g.65832 Transcript_44366/m.65832 type:complete len:89 (+) Transcript_44366:97-363(+)